MHCFVTGSVSFWVAVGSIGSYCEDADEERAKDTGECVENKEGDGGGIGLAGGGDVGGVVGVVVGNEYGWDDEGCVKTVKGLSGRGWGDGGKDVER